MEFEGLSNAGGPLHRPRRSVTVAEVVEFIEYLAPPVLAIPTSPFGLQIGAMLSTVKSVIVAPFAGARAIRSAAARKSSLLVTAAPLLAAPLGAVTWDDPLGSKIAQLIQKQISLYALSTAYAAAPGGLDDGLSEQLGLAPIGALIPTAAEAQLKFEASVPRGRLRQIQEAAAEAGATDLKVSVQSLLALSDGAMPWSTANASGRKDALHEEPDSDRLRLEMRFAERDLKGVVAAILEAFPDKDISYDIIPLRNPGVLYGRGRFGELPLKVSLDTVLAQVNDALGLRADNSARCSHRPGKPIGSLAVASGLGAGEGLLWAASNQDAGALIVGGIGIADLMLVDELNTVVIDVGFAASVRPGLQRLAAQIRNTFASDGVEVLFDE